MTLWIVVYETDGGEAPHYVGPFRKLENAERFAESVNGYVMLLDSVEDMI